MLYIYIYIYSYINERKSSLMIIAAINACLYRFLYPLLRDGGFGTG